MDDRQNNVAEEKKYESNLENLPIQNRSYKNDKNGWVEFLDKRKKVKLRKYISSFAQQLVKYTGQSFKNNREQLIEVYEKYGLAGVREFVLDVNASYLEGRREQAMEQLKELEKSVK